jgi:hypothetical protein
VTVIERLLPELEETLDVEGILPLYDFSWTVRGFGLGLSEDDIAVICQRAYDTFVETRSLHLEWFDWPPTDLAAGRRADPGTPLDFDINTTGTITSPFLALVPDGSRAEDEVDP